MVFPALGFKPLQQIDIDAESDLLFDRAVKATPNSAGKTADLGDIAQGKRINCC